MEVSLKTLASVAGNGERIDIGAQKRLRQLRLRARLRRLRKEALHAVIVEREKALIYRLLVHRFAPNSPPAIILTLLARDATHHASRIRKFLRKLPGDQKQPISIRRSFAVKCWCASHVPRKWVLLRIKHQK